MSSQNLDQNPENSQPKHTFLPQELENDSVFSTSESNFQSQNQNNVENNIPDYILNDNLNVAPNNSRSNDQNPNTDFQTHFSVQASPDRAQTFVQDASQRRTKPQSSEPILTQPRRPRPVKERGSRATSFDFKKIGIYSGLTLVLLISLFAKQPLGLLVFWLVSLLSVKYRSQLAWIVVLICLLFLVTSFPVTSYLTLAVATLTLLSAIFLGTRVSLSKFNKYIIGFLALVLGLWVSIPMSEVGSLKYIQTQYEQNALFKNVVDSAYIGAGSPKLSPTDIEKTFKMQISSEIASAVKDKTKLLPSETSKVAELCNQLGVEQNQSEICKNLDKKNLDKTVDETVSSQVDQQTQDLKDQFYRYPQVQMVQNFLNGLGGSNNAILKSPYFVPGIVLLAIYVVVAGLLQLISWPILILFKRISLF